MTTITVTNPYYEKNYRVEETKQEVLKRIYDYTDEPERIPNFEALDEYGKECIIFINPNNFASVKVTEEE